ncbi:hypothetical protein P7C70_g6904, partial [Phenoliferia sp. Uapishka_3]
MITRLRHNLEDVFQPLLLLLPKTEGDLEEEEHRPLLIRTDLKNGRRDFNLLCIGFTVFALFVVPGITIVKLMFARFQFGWGAEEVSGYITFIAVSKLFFLLGVLPVGLKRLRSPAPTPERPRPISTGPESTSQLEILTDEQRQWDVEARLLELIHDSRKSGVLVGINITEPLYADADFDLRLAQASIVFAIVAYIFTALPSKSPKFFLLGTGIVSFSSGAIPALQSLALSLSSPRDAGRLLAGIAVLSSIALEIVGPTFFGAIYVWSIDWYPQLVFVAAVVWFICALLPALALNLPSKGEFEEEA